MKLKNRILITGGAGYIGSKLSTRLVELGFAVTVIDILKYNKNSLSHLLSHKNFNFIHADTRNKKILSAKLYDLINASNFFLSSPSPIINSLSSVPLLK